MPLPIFEKQADVPAPFADLYEERDGKWHPKPSDDDAAEIKAALKKEREARSALEKRAKAADDARADMERQLATLTSGEDKDKAKKLLEKFDADLAKIRADSKAEIDAANAKLRTLQLTDKLKAAMLKAGVLPTRVDAALKLKEHLFDLEGDRIVVKDEKGEVTTKSLDDFLVKDFRTEMPEWYQGTKATGGGARGADGTSAHAGGTRPTADEIAKNPKKALEWANENEVART